MVRMSRSVERQAVQLGEYLSAWRKVLDLTTVQVAERAGVTRGALRAIEVGAGTASLAAVLQVAQALGVLDKLVDSVDPLSTDIGRLRAGLINRKRVRRPIAIVARSVGRLIDVMLGTSQRDIDMRQVSPFAHLVNQAERRDVLARATA